MGRLALPAHARRPYSVRLRFCLNFGELFLQVPEARLGLVLAHGFHDRGFPRDLLEVLRHLDQAFSPFLLHDGCRRFSHNKSVDIDDL